MSEARAGGDPLAALFAAGDGRAPALIGFAPEPWTWDRAALLEAAGRWQAAFAGRGLGPGERVLLWGDNDGHWVAAALGALRAGVILVPIDPQADAAAVERIRRHSGAAAVYAGERQRGTLDAEPLQTPRVDPAAAGRVGRAEDIAVLFYTSGTTGEPKGVPLSRRNLGFQIEAIAATGLVGPRDRVLLPLPLHHVYPFVLGLLTPLALGLAVVFPAALTGPALIDAVRRGRATVIAGVPRLYRALSDGLAAALAGRPAVLRLPLQAAWTAGTRLADGPGRALGRLLTAPLRRRFAPLRLLASGGAALDPDVGRRLRGLGWDIGIGYGLTETSPLLTVNLPGQAPLDSVGRPVPGVELRLAPVAGVDEPGVGEVQARGPGVFRGYWNDPERSAEAFTEDGWFRTGDLGRFDQGGNLYLHGRRSTLIVTESGKNIQPEPLETHYEAHPYIAEIGVLGADGRLVAVVVPDRAALAGVEDAREALRVALAERGRDRPSYERIADFVVHDQPLPRTRLGKIRRHELAALYRRLRAGRAPAPPGPDPRLAALQSEPRCGAALRLLTRLYPDRPLTPDTHLSLDLGVDSLERVRLSLLLQQECGVELPAETWAAVDTVGELLAALRDGPAAGGGPPLDPKIVLSDPARHLDPRAARWARPLPAPLRPLPWAGHGLLRAWLRLYFGLRVADLERLPADRPWILAPNHASLLDPVVVFGALPWSLLERTHFAGWTGIMFENAPMRAIARLSQTLPVDPRRGPVASLACAALVLAQGRHLVWFPEGGRSPDGRLMPLKPGLGLLVKHRPVPVFPAWIEGSQRALPRGARWPRRVKLELVVGEALVPAAQDTPERFTARLEAALRALGERVRGAPV